MTGSRSSHFWGSSFKFMILNVKSSKITDSNILLLPGVKNYVLELKSLNLSCGV